MKEKAQPRVHTFIAKNAETTRLLKGSRGQVERFLLNEWAIERASAEEAHALKDVDIEDVSEEP